MSDINLTDNLFQRDVNLEDSVNLKGKTKQESGSSFTRPHIDADRVARPTVGQQLEQTFGMGAVQAERRSEPPMPPQQPVVKAKPSATSARQPAFERRRPAPVAPRAPAQEAADRLVRGVNDDGAEESSPPVVYSERRVIDEKGNSLGRVSDVIFEGTDSKPTWMVVKPGVFRAARYVPVRGSYATVTDKLVVPFDQRTISSSPKAKGTHVLTSRERALLTQHYKLDLD